MPKTTTTIDPNTTPCKRTKERGQDWSGYIAADMREIAGIIAHIEAFDWQIDVISYGNKSRGYSTMIEASSKHGKHSIRVFIPDTAEAKRLLDSSPRITAFLSAPPEEPAQAEEEPAAAQEPAQAENPAPKREPRSIRLERTHVNSEHINLGAKDKYGREIGTRITTYTIEFIPAPEDATSYWTVEPGIYQAWIGQATRNGSSYGASQKENRSKTKTGRDMAIEKYIDGARKRATKK